MIEAAEFAIAGLVSGTSDHDTRAFVLVPRLIDDA